MFIKSTPAQNKGNKVINFISVLFLLLVLVIIVRTLAYNPPEQVALIDTATLPLNIDETLVTNHLSQAIQFQTVSYEDDNKIDKSEFTAFASWLRQTYPAVYAKIQLVILNQHTLVFYWRGSQQDKAAILLSAHYDVVPVIPGTEKDWQHPPFKGVVSDGYIWGRGTMDDKGSAIAVVESINALVQQDFTPQGDIYVALTHDEEIGSEFGAKAVANWLSKKKVDLAWSLDEGSAILDGIVPGIYNQVAMVNIAEKGYLNLELVANATGGHSSMPPKETAVSILAEAIVALKNNPVTGGLTDVSAQIYDNLGKHMSFGYRILFANTWLFKPVIEKVMGDIPSGNAMLRTTTAPTMLTGSIKSNVLPINATAVVNFRVHPRDSVEDVINHVKTVINDERIDINTVTSSSASKVSEVEGIGFRAISQSVKAVYTDVIVTPGVTIAATDSRYYSEITQAYRFNPMVLNKQDLARMHGTNERITVDNFVKAIQFYSRLMQQQ